MNELKNLIKACKASVTIEINNHRDCYVSIANEITNDGVENLDGIVEKIGKDVYSKMVETDTLVKIQFYPHTPIGFYTVWHYDLEEAIKEAWQIIQEDCPELLNNQNQ
jgi:hypothetical protein